MFRRRVPLAALLVAAAVFLPAALAQDKKDKEKEKPKKLEPNEQEKAVLELTNKEREKAKLPPLKYNAVLHKVARGHSANMAKKREMSHKLDGKNPYERLEAAGYKYAGMAENIAVTTDKTPAQIVKDWMESKIHRENILTKEFTEIGIGVVKNEQGEVYYTQVFAEPLGQ
ncbi:MAG TPA: CAP domain-containing protein [Gemmataceae bacterium]|nr:CAP domain-containing protein [Gemmataceae bacterium]